MSNIPGKANNLLFFFFFLVSAERPEVFSPGSYSFHACLCSPADEAASRPPDTGLFHIWESAGPSVQLCPERVLLSIPVVQAALGEHHGVLLVQGECVKHGCSVPII